MADAREQWQAVLRKYKLNPDAPGSEECWSPELETCSRDRLKEIQSDKIVAVVRYIYECSRFYHDKFQRAGLVPADVKSIDDLWKIPITLKQELVEDQALNPPWGTYSPISQELWGRRGWTLFTTGGSTAEPRAFRYTSFDLEMTNWTFARGFWSIGVRPGDIATFTTNYGAHQFMWMAHESLVSVGRPVIALGGADVKRRIAAIDTYKPTVLTTTASFAIYMGETMREMGLDPAASSIRLILVGGEPGAAILATKLRVEQLWNAELHEYYGCTEVGPAAHTCRAEARRKDRPMNFHFQEDCYIPEVVDPQTLEPVPEGTRGVLVLTNVSLEGTPTPRYLIGDYTTITTEPCACGRTHARAIGGVMGRCDDMLNVRGFHVYPSAVEEIINRVPGLSESYEIVVDNVRGADRVTVVAEPHPEVPESQFDHLRHRIVEEVAGALEIKVDVELRPYGSMPRGFKTRRIRDLRGSP